MPRFRCVVERDGQEITTIVTAPDKDKAADVAMDEVEGAEAVIEVEDAWF